ncbi:hypothetical protein EV363DRAFT_220507, partial [Boletus edulis]
MNPFPGLIWILCSIDQDRRFPGPQSIRISRGRDLFPPVSLIKMQTLGEVWLRYKDRSLDCIRLNLTFCDGLHSHRCSACSTLCGSQCPGHGPDKHCAWCHQTTGVRFIADDEGELTSSLGLLFDASGLLGSPRSKCYAIVAQDNKVQFIAVETEPADTTMTASEVVLSQIA